MKGLPKPILNCIIEHATLDDFGQFLLMSRHVGKVFERVVKDLKRDMQSVFGVYGSLKDTKYQTKSKCLKVVRRCGGELEFVKNQTEEICFQAVMKNSFALRYVEDNKIRHELDLLTSQ